MQHQTAVPRIDLRDSMSHLQLSCVPLASVRGCSRSSQLWTRWRSRVGSIRSSFAYGTNRGLTPKRGIPLFRSLFHSSSSDTVTYDQCRQSSLYHLLIRL